MSVWRALSHRNYRLYFTGQFVSLMGTWMQLIAIQWLVYRLTGSPFYLGLVGFSSQIPSMVITPFAGVLIDRFSRRRILMGTQLLSLLQASLLAGLVLTDAVQVWQVFVLSFFLGCVNAVDMPTRQSFVVELLNDRGDLNNAIALNSLMINAARLIGPSVAGLLIAAVGEGLCFLLNALSFLAVITALAMMRLRPVIQTVGKPGLDELREGWSFAYRSLPIRNMLALMSAISLVGLAYPIVLPVFARDIYGGGADALGYLMGAVGIGAVLGGFWLASRKSAAGLEKVLPAAAVALGIALGLFSQTRDLAAGLMVLLLCGFAMILFISSTNTLIQTVVDDDKRGRVMSLYTMSFMGMSPLGSLLAGAMASRIGTEKTVLTGGLICIAGGMLFASGLKRMRPGFERAFTRSGH